MLRIFLIALFSISVLLAASPLDAQVLPLPPSDSSSTETSEAKSGAVDSLLEVLKDDTQRSELIERLEAIQTNEIAATTGAEQPSNEATQTPTFAREIADLTKAGIERVYETVADVWRDFTGIRSLVSGINEQRQTRIVENGPPLIGTIIATIFFLWLFTLVFTRLTSRRSGINDTMWANVITVLVNAVADVTALALAYAAGYAVAISLFGRGSIAVEQSLYLNAFLIAGIARILLRIFVLPDRPEQAVFNFSSNVQKAIYTRLVIIGGVLIYGITAAIPIANIWLSFLAGRSISVTVVTVSAILALLSIRQIARLINSEQLQRLESEMVEIEIEEGAGAEEIADAASEDAMRATLSVWYRSWPWLAAIYVVFAYLIAIAQPSLMTDLIGAATIKTVIAFGFLALAFRFMKRASTIGAPVPRVLQSALPELKDRLDRFVPMMLRFLSLALIIIAAAFLIDAWHVFDIGGWVKSPIGIDIIWRVVSALLIFSIVVLIWAIISSWIDNRLSLDLDGKNVNARSRTLLALFRNAFTVALFIFGAMTALSQLGIDIAPLLAGAGVIGLAIGFGSQKLVQDIITGIFIQLDNAINEGDVITVGGITGGVEKLTIRSVSLRDINGTYHIVPFSSVDTVSNFMRKFAYHVAIVGVAYKEKLPVVKEAMYEAFRRLNATEHARSILGELEMHGVIELADSSVNLRARIKTRPGKQWEIGRAFTEIIKEVFDEQEIEIPFPHRQMVYPPQPNEIKALPGETAENAI